MPLLEDKIAIVTGAGRGIGYAIALRLAQEACTVVISDIDQTSAEESAHKLAEVGAKSLSVRTDVSKSEDAESLVTHCVETFGGLDILVNNAGITRDSLLIRMNEADWDSVIAVNLKGTYNCLRAAAKVMIKKRSGRIINIASVVGLIGNVGQANYTASKAGVVGLTKTAAKELGSRGIQVNAVAPGFIETEMTKELPEQVRTNFLSNVALRRTGTPEDVAEVVLFLSSPASAYITGQVLNVDGGMVM